MDQQFTFVDWAFLFPFAAEEGRALVQPEPAGATGRRTTPESNESQN